jgi:Microbial-type PARG, catalytic domain
MGHLHSTLVKVSGEMSRQQRAAVAAETMKLLRDGGYIAPSGRRVDLRANVKAAVARTRLYLPDELALQAAEPMAGLETSIQVTGESTLAATRRLAASADGEVGALNFASARHPGGGFLSGAAAQEESLARASGLYACLRAAPDFYRSHHIATATGRWCLVPGGAGCSATTPIAVVNGGMRVRSRTAGPIGPRSGCRSGGGRTAAASIVTRARSRGLRGP